MEGELMALVIAGIVCWVVLAVSRGGGTDESPQQQPQIGGAVLQAHRIDRPQGLPIPGPPSFAGFVFGAIVCLIGWALWL